MEGLAQYFQHLAALLPLEVFVLVGTFVEEVIAPIPSFFVLFPAGVAAELQGRAVWYLALLAVLSGIGRIAGGSILYWLADRFEGALLTRHRIFGLPHKEVERFGRHMGRSGRRDWMLLFVMNAMPIFPSAVLSLICGFIKVPYKRYVSATYCGTIINAMIYMGMGYGGLAAADVFHDVELAGILLTAVALAALLLWLVRRRTSGHALKLLHRKKAI